MNIEKRIAAFSLLGQYLENLSAQELRNLSQQAQAQNQWFTQESVNLAIDGIKNFLNKETLTRWTSSYQLQPHSPKSVGVAMAGNIPLVGFHDALCVLVSGHRLICKLSSQDSVLMRHLFGKLTDFDPELREYIREKERLNNVDAAIATGSDNTSRYFDYYFRKIPHIIRKNRSSCAVIMGEESEDELYELGKDVFSYFGLGCRNISKLYAPSGYDFTSLLKSWERFGHTIHHHKYANNYDYQKSILLVNRIPFLDNGCVLLNQNTALVSPISMVHYEQYEDQADLADLIDREEAKLQCIASAKGWFKHSIPFGMTQLPKIDDYADGIDTMKFLSEL